jgi:flagellar FliL protein
LFNVPAYASGAGGSTGTSPNYVLLQPAFVVNVTDGDVVRHMQVKAQLKLSRPELAEQIEKHKPAIQHEMVMLLSGRPVAQLRTIQGKEVLRKEAVAVLQKLLMENTGEPIVEAIYFTEFIIQ